jgi:2Fe-2S ferredoxin
MPKLFVTDREGSEKQIEAAASLTLMEAVRNNGFDGMMALCGGSCSCATGSHWTASLLG